MKKFYALLGFIAITFSISQAQCTINPLAQTTPGVYPAAINLPCAQRTVFYDQTLQGKIQASVDTFFFGFQVHYDIDSFRLDSIVGLPSGITWSKSPNVLPGGGNGCVRLYGTTNASAGRYNLEGWGTAWVHLVVPSQGMDTLMQFTGNLNQYSPFGGYFVDVINPGSGCRTVYTVTLGADTGACYGDTVTLHPAMTNGQAPYNYQWSSTGVSLSCNNCQNPRAIMTATTKFSVTVTDANSNSLSDTVTVLAIGAPVQITASGPTTFCEGDSVILNAVTSFFFSQYLWSDSSTSSSDTIRQSGTYSVTVSSLGLCPFTDSITVSVNQHSINNYQITANGPTSFCGGGSVTLDAGSGFTSYHWNPGGAQTQNISVNQTNTYSVTVTDTGNCTYSDTQNINTNTTFTGQQICVVSVDQTSGKNVIVWEKAAGFGIDSFKVLKETSITSVYQLIREQAFGNFSTYEDNQSNPAQQSDRYVITTIDACGESVHSLSHKTIHLTSNIGINNVVNLIWNAYEGFTYNSFNIFRGSSASNMSQFAQVSSSTYSYTDLVPPAPPLFYQIEVINPLGCVPAKTESFSSSRSNVIQINTLNIGSSTGQDFKVKSIFDDQTGNNVLRFNTDSQIKLAVKLFDYSGREVYYNENVTQTELVLPGYISRGIYIAEVKNAGKDYRLKVFVR